VNQEDENATLQAAIESSNLEEIALWANMVLVLQCVFHDATPVPPPIMPTHILWSPWSARAVVLVWYTAPAFHQDH
jgi:hypothetical protein